MGRLQIYETAENPPQVRIRVWSQVDTYLTHHAGLVDRPDYLFNSNIRAQGTGLICSLARSAPIIP